MGFLSELGSIVYRDLSKKEKELRKKLDTYLETDSCRKASAAEIRFATLVARRRELAFLVRPEAHGSSRALRVPVVCMYVHTGLVKQIPSIDMVKLVRSAKLRGRLADA